MSSARLAEQRNAAISQRPIENGAGLAEGALLDRGEMLKRLRSLVLLEQEQFLRSANNGALPSKSDLRQRHSAIRQEIFRRDHQWIASKAPKLLSRFASSSEVVPVRIIPRLVQVETEEQQALFRLARYTWSLP